MPIKKMYICVMGTSKTRYIELHGEDAWELEAKRRSERYKKWRDANPEKKKQYDRDYHNANKERLNELARKNGAIYWKNNKKKLTDKQRRYRNASMVAKSYALFRNYSRDDKNRGLSVDQNIDRDWIIKNLILLTTSFVPADYATWNGRTDILSKNLRSTGNFIQGTLETG